VAEALRMAGAHVEEVDLGWRRADIMRAITVHFGAIFGSAIRDEAGDQAHLLMPYTRAFSEEAVRACQETSYFEGLEIEGRLYAELGTLLEQFDVLVCPTSGMPALLAGEDYVDTQLIVDGMELESYLESLLTPAFNIASRCPVLAVPSGRASNGVPTGVQIVGRTYEDAKVFQAGAALEQVRPWFADPSQRPTL
jgi:aspartyl-tRNA(Asn)/glutamyl-tRNA(Gln) amidotransferase subunit A